MSLLSKNQNVMLTLVLFVVSFVSTPSFAKEAIEFPDELTEKVAKPVVVEKKVELSEATLKTLFDDMILVEGGSFEMGSNAEGATDRVKPVHTVEITTLYMGKTEVTQQLFVELMGWNTSYFVCEECAMNNISWFQMQIFIRKLNLATGKKFRLPTEAEWEYAARGGNKSKGYVYSGSNDIDDVAWYAGNGEHKSHPVALKKPNELGLYDMTGNLWEFCHDDMTMKGYKYLKHMTPEEVLNDDVLRKAMKVVRGGGYDFDADEIEVYKRDGATNNVRMPDIGFRLVLDKK